MRSVVLGLVASAGAGLGLASPASAATLCVQMPAPTACAATYTTLQGAIDAAGIAYPGRDTIRVGPVTLAPEAADALATNLVDIVGSGRTATRLQSPTSASAPALTLDGSSTVSDLGILIKDVAGALSSEDGLDLSGGALGQRISITAESGMDNATGAYVGEGATLRDSTVEVPIGNANNAVQAYPGALVEDVAISGEVGVEVWGPAGSTPTTVRRVRTLTQVREGVNTRSGGTVDVSDTLLLVRDQASAAGLATTGSAGTSGTIRAYNVTVIGAGGGIGADARVDGGIIHVRDSILWGMSTSLRRVGPGTPTINVSYSNFDPATIDEAGATEGGSLVQGAGNLNVTPGFAGAADYRLAASSPLIDRGFPGAGPTTLDLARAPRVTDGNGDGVARRDIGAYEYQRPVVVQPPDGVAPRILALSLSRKKFRVGKAATPRVAAAAQKRKRRRPTPAGTRVRYRLSEAATVRFTVERVLLGRRARVRGKLRCVKPTRKLARSGAKRCKRYKAVRRATLTRTGKAGSNSFPFSGRIGKKKLSPGSYRLRAVPTDAAGNRSKPRGITFRIVRR